MHVKIEYVLVQSIIMQILACASFGASNTCHLRALQSRKTASHKSYMKPIATPNLRPLVNVNQQPPAC